MFGSHEYFLAVLPAAEVVKSLRIPKNIEGWEDLSLEERYQREINFRRVEKHIAPYLAHDPDRFFGALIVDVLNDEEMVFEPVMDVAKGLPGLYKQTAKAIGFLNMSGKEVLVPLDGQHRLAALRFAIEGKNEKGDPITGIDGSTEVAEDCVTLMLLRHDPTRSRKVFNKVNRYAKPTTKADNLVTADDDFVAVLARKVSRDVLEPRLVNWRSNTLSKRSECATTLGTLADIVELIITDYIGDKVDRTTLPDHKNQAIYDQTVLMVFETAMKSVDALRVMTADTGEGGDQNRRDFRSANLLGKPFAQLAMFEAVIHIVGRDGKGLSLSDAFSRVNLLNWGLDQPEWQYVLMNGDRIASGKTARHFASRYVAYRLGGKSSTMDREALLAEYRDRHPKEMRGKVSLPSPAV